MSDYVFLQTQKLQLTQLLESAESDPILAPQLASRLESVQNKLEAIRLQGGTLWPKESQAVPRAAIFLRGRDVQGSEGIRPSLAGEALIQYEKIFTEQAIHDEREAARLTGRHRRPKNAPTPGLLFTGTPRGSFGLEFTPQSTADDSLLAVHAQSFSNVASAIVRVTTSANKDRTSVKDVIEAIPPRMLQPLKQFLKTLASHGAELRLAFQDQPSITISAEQLQRSAEQLEREVFQQVLEIAGTFRGVTRESGVFDLRTDSGEVITGTVADHFTEEDLERIDGLTNKSCVARLESTVIQTVTGNLAPSYVLLDARP